MEFKIILGIIYFCCISHGYGIEKISKMFIKKSSSDLDSDASGYIYQRNGNAPGSMIILNSGEVLKQFQGGFSPDHSLPLIYQKPLGAHSYVVSHLSTHPAYIKNNNYANYQQSYNAAVPAPYHTHSAYSSDNGGHHHYHGGADNADNGNGNGNNKPIVNDNAHNNHYESYENGNAFVDGDSSADDDNVDDHSAAYVSNDHGIENGDDHGYLSAGYHYDDGNNGGASNEYNVHGDDHGHHAGFSKGDKSDYELEHHNEHGDKGSKGYNHLHEYSKGDKGSYDKSDHSDNYDKHGNKKASAYDEGDHHNSFHEGDKAQKGGKFGEKKNHKKGSKTTGYHNVFHKDEYKKDHTFYDNADHKGHFSKNGKDHKDHKTEGGDFKKGGHHDSGYHKDDHGKKGQNAKGHHDNADKGHHNKHGYDAYHHHNQDYGKQDGHHDKGYHGSKSSGHH